LLKLVSYIMAVRATREDKGATAVEYGLIVAAIAAVIVALVFTLGTKVQAGFQTVCTKMNGGTAC
jgi:pilus assembly protein Flp/PilA